MFASTLGYHIVYLRLVESGYGNGGRTRGRRGSKPIQVPSGFDGGGETRQDFGSRRSCRRHDGERPLDRIQRLGRGRRYHGDRQRKSTKDHSSSVRSGALLASTA